MWRRIKKGPWDFPSGPVVKTPHFHCRRHRFNPWLGNEDPTCCAMWPKKKKRRRDLYGRKVLTFFTGKAAGVSQVREAEDVRERGRVQMEGDLH